MNVIIIVKRETTNLKENEEWYMGGFEGRKGKGGMMCLYYLKNKREN